MAAAPRRAASRASGERAECAVPERNRWSSAADQRSSRGGSSPSLSCRPRERCAGSRIVRSSLHVYSTVSSAWAVRGPPFGTSGEAGPGWGAPEMWRARESHTRTVASARFDSDRITPAMADARAMPTASAGSARPSCTKRAERSVSFSAGCVAASKRAAVSVGGASWADAAGALASIKWSNDRQKAPGRPEAARRRASSPLCRSARSADRQQHKTDASSSGVACIVSRSSPPHAGVREGHPSILGTSSSTYRTFFSLARHPRDTRLAQSFAPEPQYLCLNQASLCYTSPVRPACRRAGAHTGAPCPRHRSTA
eukprot:scaffold7991_cov106-Isochrysis_galbana.AAC.2